MPTSCVAPRCVNGYCSTDGSGISLFAFPCGGKELEQDRCGLVKFHDQTGFIKRMLT